MPLTSLCIKALHLHDCWIFFLVLLKRSPFAEALKSKGPLSPSTCVKRLLDVCLIFLKQTRRPSGRGAFKNTAIHVSRVTFLQPSLLSLTHLFIESTWFCR
jgi:hypothetical protein